MIIIIYTRQSYDDGEPLEPYHNEIHDLQLQQLNG